ncbi:MAG TPA: hypothetical protein VJX67_20245 [Blastocatellia bacterium]|nr:hypothetical protein [Blastocatellia bacterium]
MDDRVKDLLKQLGEAISEAVSDSHQVEAVLQAIRDSGFEARLLLEAIIAVEDKRSGWQEESEITLRGGNDFKEDSFTPEDRRFLRHLKIEI